MLGREKSKDIAASRLKSVLREDRTTVSARDIALMQLDVLAALSGYLEMERDEAETAIARDRLTGKTLLEFSVPVRAVTFQSMKRGSSPGAYSRKSSKSRPWPRKLERYCPAKVAVASLRAFISMRRTFCMISCVLSMGCKGM